MPLSPGVRLGPYEILASIGRGSMGEVYRAKDTRLDRLVAVKQLFGSHTSRFEHEARAIAALNHPHICQVYDVGPDYLVLEHIEGSPVCGPLTPLEARRLAIQIAGALDAAHRHGLIHRDLKPANIMVTTAGDAKLLDFGIATQQGDDADVTLTQTGTILGTVAYMSPEQTRGTPLDARSDIFSFGAVLYEMLAGTRAFSGSTIVDVAQAIAQTDPPPLRAPRALERIVTRCLARDPERRFQTMAEVREALEAAVLDTETAPARASIAVLPFANMSADAENEYFSDGLAEEIINALAHIPDLKVIARTSAFAFKGKQEDIRRIAEVLGVAHVLEGSVRRSGTRIRVTAQLIAAADGSHLWSERFDRELADVFAIQDEIAGAIAESLHVRLIGEGRPVRRHEPTLPAYEAFLRARHHLFKFTPESWERAKERYEEAIALDPAYAEPHANLGFGYFMAGVNGIQPLTEVVPLVRAEARKALALDPSNRAPQFLLGAIAATYDYDWTEAAEQFRASMSAAHVTADAHWAYASFYLQALGQHLEGLVEMERAIEQDPVNASWRSILSSHCRNAGLNERAVAEALNAVDIDEGLWLPHFVLGEAYLATGQPAKALAAATNAHTVAPWNAMPTGLLAGVHAHLGDQARADELMKEMGDEPRPIWGRVLYHLLVSDVDAAATWYERMIERRDPFALVFAHSTYVAPLRQSAQWPALAAMMRLP